MKESEESAAHPLGRIKAKALPDDVYDALLDMLTWGTLEPDTPLSIDGLAQSLGVSPTPVREALARLEPTGLVRRSVRRGYRVSPPMSQAQMYELADARLVLESGAIERSMRHADEVLPDLEAAFSRHERSAQELLEPGHENVHEYVRRYFEDDWSFHEAILNHCGNRYLAQAVDSLSFRMHRMRQTVGIGVSDVSVAVPEHHAILEAVRRGDTAGAVAAMRFHLERVRYTVSEDGTPPGLWRPHPTD
ncbi:GntR family transcriptional regulator [Raineyella fluvialis]|uniref:FCD domain-containing protein n=1 Tax=Raineyella fluvialis TaxID=2662261 RepID=A0A5Q2FFS2_9ACTN|nr:GntR family transcriptional regulator [Raineyella fluvialis]QGF23525.1 FCD domain-containing protein [Raineyella fluvialis]